MNIKLSSPAHSPSHRSKATQPAEQVSPIKYLLQNNVNLHAGKQSDRGPEEVEVISRLLKQNRMFSDLGLDIAQSSMAKELSNGVVLIYCESPHIMEAKDNEAYMFFEGQGFEYMQNKFQGEQSKKYKLYENNEYIMLRKIATNEYFLSLQDYNGRYHTPQKKYQLMVDENTLIGKVSQELFFKLLQPRILERQKHLVTFLKKISIFNGLPNSFFMEFTKFITDDQKKGGQKVITRDEKSKYVYIIRSGEVEIRYYGENRKGAPINSNYQVSPTKPYSLEKLANYDTFGMDVPEQEGLEKQVICLSDCLFFKIDKRLLAIIITSFELQFQQKNKLWSEVNINNQIKGQNYSSPEQQLLNKNAQRIRTAERKIRDIKLKYLSSNKPKKDLQFQPISRGQSQREQIEEKTIENLPSQQSEKKRMIKTTEGRFRSTSVGRFINNMGLLDDKKYDLFRQKLVQEKGGTNQQIAKISHIEFVPLDDQDDRKLSVLRYTNAFEYRQKVEQQKFVRSNSKGERNQGSQKFIPKVQNRLPMHSGGSQKIDSDMIGVFLDKKIKNEIVKKAQKVMSINKNLKSIENRNIKRLFAGKDSRGVNALSQHDRRTIADDIVQRMSNLKGNPLLLQIESQRRKMQRQMKLMDRRPKIEDNPNRKYKKQDELILIRNNKD